MTITKKLSLNNNSSVGKTFLPILIPPSSQQPTSADKEAYDQVKASAPSAETHPHTFAWYALVSRFSDAVRNSWAAPAAPAKAKAAPAKKEEPKKEAAPADDDLDLFGDSGPTEVRIYILNRGVNLYINRKNRSF